MTLITYKNFNLPELFDEWTVELKFYLIFLSKKFHLTLSLFPFKFKSSAFFAQSEKYFNEIIYLNLSPFPVKRNVCIISGVQSMVTES